MNEHGIAGHRCMDTNRSRIVNYLALNVRRKANADIYNSVATIFEQSGFSNSICIQSIIN